MSQDRSEAALHSGAAAAAIRPRARMLGAGALLLALALLIASAFALNVNLSELDDRRAILRRTNAILQNISKLEASIRAAETGQRGFVLTGEPRYLEPYRTAAERVWTTYEELADLVQHPEQVARIRQLRPLLDEKLGELARTVALRETSFEAATEVVRTDVGQRLMEEIEGVIRALQAEEHELLEQRNAEEARTVLWTSRTAVLTATLALVSAVIGTVALARQRAQAHALEAERVFRRELEQRVEERTRELTEMNRELDAFAYTISHDLRSPLRSMQGFADALAEDYGDLLPQEGRDYTARIGGAVLRMEGLIEDILTYSRIARQEMPLTPVSLDIVVSRVLLVAAPEIAATGAQVEVSASLPEVLANPTGLEQALTNLVTNALKFTAPGQKPKIRIGTERHGRAVILSVIDEGIGVAPEHSERIFRPFERLHGIESYPGTGIGLAIVRRCVERMGGQCGVVSNIGKGSRFWIAFPAAAGA